MIKYGALNDLPTVYWSQIANTDIWNIGSFLKNTVSIVVGQEVINTDSIRFCKLMCKLGSLRVTPVSVIYLFSVSICNSLNVAYIASNISY